MMKGSFLRPAAVGICLLLLGLPAWAGDLKADIETVLRRMANDPDSIFLLEMEGAPSIALHGEGATLRIDGLKAVPKTDRKGGLSLGAVVAEVGRREDGGLIMTLDLPRRAPLRSLSGAANLEFGFEEGRLVLEWGKDLAETDAVTFSAAKVTNYDVAGKAEMVLLGPLLRQRRGGPDGREGSFSMHLAGLENPAGGSLFAFAGWGPLEFSGHYENFPHDLYRDEARYLMLWEAARAARADAQVNFDVAAQSGALMREAQTRYVIDRFEFKTPMISTLAKGDFHFSLEASRGLYGTMTAWVSETGKADSLNPMMMTGAALLARYGEAGKTPEGEPARIFRIGLAADGTATLNEEPAPVLAASIGNFLKTMSLTMNGFAAPRPQPAVLVAGATGCGVPVYPPASLAAKETGRTNLVFIYDDSGAVKMTNITSSGYSRLDEAARLAFISCRFAKGTTEAHIPVDWKIEGGVPTATVGGGLTTITK